MQSFGRGVALPYFALSDLKRLRVIRLMAVFDRKTCLTELANVLCVAPSQLSKHLQLLVWAGILDQERDGRTIWLSLSRRYEHFDPLYASVIALPDDDGVFSADVKRLKTFQRS